MLPGIDGTEGKDIVAPKLTVTVPGMDKTMSASTKKEVMNKLRRRYQSAGREHKTKLIDQAIALMGYHCKAAIRALRTTPKCERLAGSGGRPREYEFAKLGPVLRVIWEAADFPCALRLATMLPEWVPALGYIACHVLGKCIRPLTPSIQIKQAQPKL